MNHRALGWVGVGGRRGRVGDGSGLVVEGRVRHGGKGRSWVVVGRSSTAAGGLREVSC